VVPLVTAEEAVNLPSPITIEPPVNGAGEWLNTSIYIFRPDPGLEGGIEYTVSVNSDLQAQDGSTLEAPFSWSFSAVAPAIVEVVPEASATDVALDGSVQVKFNQPMDRTSVESSFYLRPQGQAAGSVDGSFEWADDNAGFRFTPTDGLQINNVYDAGVNAGAKTAQGGSSLADSSAWSFATIPLPGIISTSPLDGEEGVYPYGSFTIFFASPMNIETLPDKITIEPEPWREADFYYSDYDNSYNLNFPVEPSTDYTLTIASGMQDVYGNAIEETRVIRYSTAPYEPSFLLQVPGEIGFYNAHNEQTRLYLVHRNTSRLDLQL
jgi:hypothetical protein